MGVVGREPKVKVLVVGKTGQLARSFEGLRQKSHGIEIRCEGRPEVDLCNDASLEEVFSVYRPHYVVNTAAYTAVDKAEEDEANAFEINAVGVHRLASCCKKYEARLIHVSTDYVFDGSMSHPLKVDDEVAPLGAYGRSKLAGEWAARSVMDNSIIVRTSWLYGDGGGNFVSTMLELGKTRDHLKVVKDQMGRPTYARDLAASLVQLVRGLADGRKVDGGVYHYSNAGEVVSWYGFAEAIFERAKGCGMKVPEVLEAIPSEEYPTPAERPKWSVMDLSATEEAFGLEIEEWQNSLDKYFNKNYTL